MATQHPDDGPKATPTPVPAPPPVADDYHCPNCLFLEDPETPGVGFWACQNLCVRE